MVLIGDLRCETIIVIFVSVNTVGRQQKGSSFQPAGTIHDDVAIFKTIYLAASAAVKSELSLESGQVLP